MASEAVDAEPLTAGEMERLLRPLHPASGIVLAVSGGPDSVALMHLAATVAEVSPLPRLHVATVDHGLRPESRAVAEAVAEQAAQLGLRSAVLVWRGPKPSAGIQEAARRARYDLLCAHADAIGATHLVTAHTLDDQAETVMIRMARGSGLSGLAGMRRTSARGNLVHVRPLLGIPKHRLVAACRAAGWRHFDDPANADLFFNRTRWRRLLPELAAEGLDAHRLGQLARRLAEADCAIEAQAQRACREARAESQDRFAWARLAEEPRAIRLRALEIALTGFARDGRPRLGRLETAATAFEQAHRTCRPLRRTLHGAMLTLSADGVLTLDKEGLRRRGSAGN